MNWWKAYVLPAVLLVLAEIGARAAAPSDTVAPPSSIALAFIETVQDGSLLSATQDTLVSASAGLAIGGGVGLCLGILLGSVRPLDRLLEFTIELLRPIPSVAILPVALVALGFGFRLEIAIVAFSCLWPLMMLTRAAVRDIEPRLIDVAAVLGLSPLQSALKIIAPAALSRIFVAFRLAAGIALIVSVTVEIAINPQGLGFAIMTAGQALRPELMLAFLVWIGIVGFALNSLLLLAQSRLFGRATPSEVVR